MKSASHRCAASLVTASALLGGCVSTTEPVQMVAAAPQAATDRQAQTRRYDGIEEAKLFAASVGVLQDLGFTIKLSDAQLGLIVGTKEQEAKAPEQKAAYTLLLMLLAIAAAQSGGAGVSIASAPPPSEEQTVGVMLVFSPAGPANARDRQVRVTFHRFVRHPFQWVAGSLRDAELYEAFFDLLSKAVFLEAHKL